MTNKTFFKNFKDKLINMYPEEDRFFTDNGSVLLKNVPMVAPMAYFHYIFSPMSEKQVDSLETVMAYPIPEEIRLFFLEMNGLKIFCGTLYINGVRTNSARTAEANNQQPFDIVLPNSLAHGYHVPNTIYLGGYKCDGSIVGYNIEDGSIHRQLKTNKEKLNVWPSLPAFLDSEFFRLQALFDQNGLKKESVNATTPPTIH